MASSFTEMAIFQRVAERGSFAGAAEDVGLSPSAVAKLITRLEQRLGVRLINSTTRRLRAPRLRTVANWRQTQSRT
jgi:DNA-binding transcriptional LysR family regulator